MFTGSLDQQYQERIATALHPNDRATMASEKTCPVWLLRAFCQDEIEPTVACAAVLNPLCPEEYIQIAFNRFPELNSEELLNLRKKRQQIRLHLNQLSDVEEEAKKQVFGDRDQVVSKHLLENNGPEVNSSSNKFIQVYSEIPWANTSKYRIAMVMAPSWGVLFPPYNISKLTGMLRNNGYSVKAYDINVEAYHFFLKEHGEDYWRGERYFLWESKENFEKYILPDLQPILYRIAEDIALSGVKVVGFSLYITNYYATMVLARYLKTLVPDICFVVGGPETITGSRRFETDAKNMFNYIFVGESEETLLYTLENRQWKLMRLWP